MDDILTCCVTFMSSAWGFFTEVKIPGTELTVAMLSAGLLFISIAFHLLSLVLGFNVGAPSDSYGARRSRKTKISEQRKHDEK